MTAFISIERMFSLSALEGLRLIRKYSARQPKLKTLDIVPLIESLEVDGASFDLEASSYLNTLVDDKCPTDGKVFYQECIKAILIKHQPIWSKTMRVGRKRFVRGLDINDQDVFIAAGLMVDPPSADIVTWWDDITGHAKLISDLEKMRQARDAELLTIEYERMRLKNEGIERKVEWPGLDDNFAGYDVLSYEKSERGTINNRMIEVKSTINSPLRFWITRNEWRQAKRADTAYLFHLWDMAKDPPNLHIRSVADIAPHIPSDNGKGEWFNATILVDT